MSGKKNRKRRRQNDVPKQSAAGLAQSLERDELRLDELRPQASVRPMQPRKFRSREFIIGPFTVTVSGEDGALENEFWPRQEGEELVLLFGDAALEARVARQQRTAGSSGVMEVVPARAAASVFAGQTVVVPARAAASVFAGQAVVQTSATTAEAHDPRGRYSEERLNRTLRDAQDAALADVGMDMASLAADFAPGLVGGDDWEYGPV